MTGQAPTARGLGAVVLDGDSVLTQADIAELGLEEAPEEAGPSLEEIITARMGRPGHG